MEEYLPPSTQRGPEITSFYDLTIEELSTIITEYIELLMKLIAQKQSEEFNNLNKTRQDDVINKIYALGDLIYHINDVLNKKLASQKQLC